MHNRLGITRIRRLGPLVACALAAAGIGSVFGDVPSPSSDTPAPDSIALQVAEETAKFDIKAKTSETTADKALSASIALRHGDFKLTSSIAREALKKSRMEAFHFSPFNRFINSLSDGNEADFSAGVNQWVAQEPRSGLAYLVRANYEYDTAWAIRGTDLPHKVTKEHWKGFKDGLTQAEDDIQQSLKLDPKIPFTYYLWVNVSASRGDEAHMAEVFQTAIARFPNYYELYNARLHFLEPKWHGSEETMYDFVAQYAGKAPAGSPLKVLYLQLAANLLNAAAFDCGKLKHELLNACVESNMNRHVTGVLTDGISQAFAVAQHVDPIQFNQAVWPILGALEGTRGESTAVNSILTIAAQAMGSENQLIHEPGHNNYVLDDITARIWMHLDNPANVDQKFREALDDVERTHFSVEEDKIAAEAAIYDHMAHAARTGSQWVRVIA